jgi:2-polyprenyl-3-methyl-5-hydroxy-6-metoxy-1,4-benzoquinol methylase
MTQTAEQLDTFDPARAEAFAGRLLNALNDGALCLMVSIGHRTGLFDTMSRTGAGSSAEIAARAGLQERYVREWLGAMLTGGIVAYDPATGRFSLPAEHASSLTRDAAADNMAVFAQYIGSLGDVETEIVECFYKGGGVPYSSFPRFHEVMAEDSGQSVLSSLESHILPLVPGLMERLEAGIEVLDLGCGRGLVLARLASLYPASRFTGIDLSEEAVAYASANTRAGSQRLRRLGAGRSL